MKHDEARKFKYHYDYDLIDAYIPPRDPENWLPCPVCGAIPKVWEFDNGRSTGCKCHNSKYDHFSIHAESVMSCDKNDGHTKNYACDGLKGNWNHWVLTGETNFEPAVKRSDGRW